MEEEKKFYQTTWFTYLMLFIFAPVGLILLWKNNIHGKVVRVIVSLFFCAAILSAVSNNTPADNVSSSSSNRAPVNTSEKVITYQRVYIDDLEEQLKQNAARAQQNWQGRYVEIRGPLETIDADGKYFSVKGSGFLNSIHCRIKNSQQKQIIISKDAGDEVIVRGKISRVGEILGYTIETTEVR